MSKNIFSIKHTLLQKADKEKLLGQKGIVLWMSGLSGSGKSTIARALENDLYDQGFLTKLLDGDNLRTGVNNNLDFSEAGRMENIRRAAEVAKLFVENGEIVICSLISPTVEIRELAKSIIGEENYFEVYINASFEECAKRDVKGLYKKALNGEIPNFTGLDAPFDAPANPFVELKTGEEDLETSKNKLLAKVLEVITLK
ncbi:MAG: adenylyl-sulfate kinase [Bacteroidetes bacterium]|nr:adenylyl-sulfate kinase [Bacteroidota bacterium]